MRTRWSLELAKDSKKEFLNTLKKIDYQYNDLEVIILFDNKNQYDNKINKLLNHITPLVI